MSEPIPIEPRLIEPGETIATAAELKRHPTKKFTIRSGEYVVEAFVVRFDGRCMAYRNQCPHAGSPLDWTPNEFFDETGDLLLCRTHGALFRPDSGECVGGPCTGDELIEIDIIEDDDGAVALALDRP